VPAALAELAHTVAMLAEAIAGTDVLDGTIRAAVLSGNAVALLPRLARNR
jgi:hypothetical protein